MDKKQKNSTIVSLVLHIILFWAIFSLHSAQILVPARSNGMEVSLISPEDLNQDTVKPLPKEEYHVVTPNAEINLKQTEVKKQVSEKQIKPIIKKQIPQKQVKITKLSKISKKKTVTNTELNDMLNDLTPAKNAGKSKYDAIGGSNSGSANTNNLNSNYADLVIAAVRPYVIIPNDITSDNVAVVQVILLPNMHVYQVKLLKASGNDEYDNNVLQAINRVPVFPRLPDGARFTDYRKLKLTFRPE